jgi:hypothetical protein
LPTVFAAVNKDRVGAGVFEQAVILDPDAIPGMRQGWLQFYLFVSIMHKIDLQKIFFSMSGKK